MTQDEARELITWLEQKSNEVEYGEISVVLKFHNCELRHVEKHVQINELPTPTRAGRYVRNAL